MGTSHISPKYFLAYFGHGSDRPALDVESFAAIESNHGFLYYTKYGKTGLWRSPIQGGAETRVLDTLRCWGYWALGHAGVYHVGGPDDREIRLQPYGGGAPLKLAGMPGAVACGESGLALSGDGRTLLAVAVNQGSDVMMADLR